MRSSRSNCAFQQYLTVTGIKLSSSLTNKKELQMTFTKYHEHFSASFALNIRKKETDLFVKESEFVLD